MKTSIKDNIFIERIFQFTFKNKNEIPVDMVARGSDERSCFLQLVKKA